MTVVFSSRYSLSWDRIAECQACGMRFDWARQREGSAEYSELGFVAGVGLRLCRVPCFSMMTADFPGLALSHPAEPGPVRGGPGFHPADQDPSVGPRLGLSSSSSLREEWAGRSAAPRGCPTSRFSDVGKHESWFSRCILSPMTKGLVRYQQTGELHFITFSCYARKPYLASPAAKELFETSLEKMRCKYVSPCSATW